MYRINEILTREERLSAIRLGAMRKLASMGMTPSSFSREVEKRAQVPSLSISGALKLALGLGIPIGAISYAMKSALMPDSNANKRLKMQLDEYNNIISQYKASRPDDETEGA